MLPPPITSASSTPRLWTSSTSSAIWASVGGSMPKPWLAHQGLARQLEQDAPVFHPGASGSCSAPSSSAERAVPRARPWPVGALAPCAWPRSRRLSSSGLARLLHHFGGEVVLLLLEALAELEADEAADLHVLADLGDQLGAAASPMFFLLVLHPRPGRAGRPPCTTSRSGRRRSSATPPRACRSSWPARGGSPSPSRPRRPGSLPADDVLRVHRGDLHRDVLGEALEVLVAGDEVGLAVDLDQHADARRRGCSERRRPRWRSRPAFLAASARPFLRRYSIAFSMSPPVSTSAFLQSIMPAPVRSRRSLIICGSDFSHGSSSSIVGGMLGGARLARRPRLRASRPPRASAARCAGATRPRRAGRRRPTRRGWSALLAAFVLGARPLLAGALACDASGRATQASAILPANSLIERIASSLPGMT